MRQRAGYSSTAICPPGGLETGAFQLAICGCGDCMTVCSLQAVPARPIVASQQVRPGSETLATEAFQE